MTTFKFIKVTEGTLSVKSEDSGSKLWLTYIQMMRP